MEDREIVGLYLARDEDAICITEQKYGVYLIDTAYRFLRDREEAKECVNDAYFDAWSSIPPQNPEYLGAYVARLVRRAAIDRYRKKLAARRGGGEADICADELSDCIPSGFSVETELEKKELSEVLTAFLRKLPDEKRRMFICRYWYSMSLREISENFNMSEAKSANVFFRLRGELKKHLEKSGIKF